MLTGQEINWQFWANEYNKCNTSVHSIAKELDLSWPKTQQKLLEQGVVLRRKKSPLSKIEIDQICTHYLKERNASETARQFNIDTTTVIYHLKKRNILVDFNPFNHNAFSKLSPTVAYWIGFIMADGHVSHEKNLLALVSKDVEHLEDFMCFLDCTHGKLYKNGDNGVKKAAVTSSQIISDLAQYGIMPAKTYTAEALNGIEWSPSFWLGMLDGDGTITIHKKTGCPELCMIGTKKIVQQFSLFVGHHIFNDEHYPAIGLEHKGRGNDVLWRTRVSGMIAQKVIRILYSENTIYLPRKRIKAEQAWKYSTQLSRIKANAKNIPCTWCSKPIRKTPYHLGKHKRHFCCRDCHQTWMVKAPEQDPANKLIVQLYQAGYGCSRIGQYVNMSHTGVKDRLVKCGIEIRPVTTNQRKDLPSIEEYVYSVIEKI
jgi:transposase-like protein